jgi:8-oxo-dGTP pyrophosphatase MutT (NUDIX family)
LGGGIEFGEDSRAALVREIEEELKAEVENIQLLGVLENLFVFEGQPGHEIVFVYDAEFVDKTLYQQETIQAYEHGNNSHFIAQWQSLKQLTQNKIRLVPEGLMPFLLLEDG